MQEIGRIEMLGWLRVYLREREITRFQTAKTGALLAYLAYHPQRTHSREFLIDLLWPDAELVLGRNRLKQALASLRRQLEPPGIPTGSVLVADRTSIGLERAALSTDVATFETRLNEAASLSERRQKISALQAAAALYGGPLLPGYYDDWVLLERERLQERYLTALCELATLLDAEAETLLAIDCLRRAVTVDPLHEEARELLVHLYQRTGRCAEAARQAQAREQWLAEAGANASSDQPVDCRTERGTSPPAPPIYHTPPDRRDPMPPLPLEPLLPVPRTRFFGRKTELRRLLRWASRTWETESGSEADDLGEIRLVTLTGPGGCGKTRLALELARQAQRMDIKVRFVSLAELTEPRHVAMALRDALQLPDDPRRSLIEQIADALSRQPTLLILDNFEQLLPELSEPTLEAFETEEGAGVIATLLERVPALSCLVTSRQTLQLEGEQEVPLIPLSVPQAGLSVEALLSYPSVQLFVDRAQKARVDFQISPRNAEAVAQVCALLEGLPLALELAAAWSRTLSPAQIQARLETPLDLLVTQRRDGALRQRSIRAALDWSYRLLSPGLQVFFARLSVFRGGWTAEAAEAVCHEPQALHRLSQLRERSLIVAEAVETDDSMRYRLLEIVRAGAVEHLADAPMWLAAHADYYLRMAEQAEVAWGTSEIDTWFDRLEADHDNLRAALEWLLAQRPEQGLRLAAALWRFWEGRGHLREGVERLTAALESVSEVMPDRSRAQALHGLATLEWQQGRYPSAEQHLHQALAIWQELDDDRGLAEAHNNLAIAHCHRGDYAGAERLFTQSRTLYERLNDQRGLANCCNNLGVVAREQNRFEDARTLHEQSLRLRREIGDRRGMTTSLMNLGVLACDQEWYAEATEFLMESLTLFREMGHKTGIASPLLYLGMMAAKRGDIPNAKQWLRESLTLFHQLAERGAASECLVGASQVALLEERFSEAAQLLAALFAVRQEIGLSLSPGIQRTCDMQIALVREQLKTAFDAVWARGSALSLDQAVTLALFLLTPSDAELSETTPL